MLGVDVVIGADGDFLNYGFGDAGEGSRGEVCVVVTDEGLDFVCHEISGLALESQIIVVAGATPWLVRRSR